MKINKIFIFCILTVVTLLSVYFFDYKNEINKTEINQAYILDYNKEQINFVQIIKGDVKISLQKSESGWSLLEPMQDLADNDKIEQLITELVNEKQVSILKNTEVALTQSELNEYGLVNPAAVFSFKNNLGKTKKIAVGSVKNFEGQCYLRVDSENKIIIASSFWLSQAENELIFYREKKLYRKPLIGINKINIKSLQDQFELVKIGDKWKNLKFNYDLDQNRIRDIIKKIAETSITEYVFDGEPSDLMIKQKGLASEFVSVQFVTDSSAWSVKLNLNTTDKAVYALTERPTYLVKIDIPAWETLGNLNLDELRNRSSAFAFNLNEVANVYVKNSSSEFSFSLANNKWEPTKNILGSASNDSDLIKKNIDSVNNFEITEFIDAANMKSNFIGNNMLILKSLTDKLVLQLNWGPAFKMKKHGVEKEYYYARTNLSEQVFAIEKNKIDSINFSNRSQKNELASGDLSH